MAEFTGGNEKDISVGEPIVFENKTECKFEVCAGVVFHKSGVYEVSIVGNRTIVSEVSKRKTGKWIKHDTGHSIYYSCSLCSCVAPYTETEDKILWKLSNFCPDCGAKIGNGRWEMTENG
jgi:hypothetical protein